LAAVNAGFPLSEQVKIRSVNDDELHDVSLSC
jgi:hypothetical protein